MIKTLLCTGCLLAGTWQTTLSQGNPASGRKSARTAMKYSVYGTAAPVVVGSILVFAPYDQDESDPTTAVLLGIHLGTLGAVVGPGLGHAYAGRWWHLAKGNAFRAVGAVLIAAGLTPRLSGMGGWGDSDGDNGNDDEGDGATILLGCVIYLWSGIHDFRTLDDTVETYNREHAHVTLSIGPTYFADKNEPGVIVGIGF